ncbi:hypothetical protein, partial [Achromobacter marplatensis]|uniref:hypothetical protein n=1 Tax=Achromobacter marplatensis TaxID=470868 RepID=UPI0039F6F47F
CCEPGTRRGSPPAWPDRYPDLKRELTTTPAQGRCQVKSKFLQVKRGHPKSTGQMIHSIKHRTKALKQANYKLMIRADPRLELEHIYPITYFI